MSQYNAMAAEYNATIQQLNDRLASAAIALFNAQQSLAERDKEIEKLKTREVDAQKAKTENPGGEAKV